MKTGKRQKVTRASRVAVLFGNILRGLMTSATNYCATQATGNIQYL